MVLLKQWTSLIGVQCQRGGAMDADGPCSPVIPGTAILAASNQTEGTGATSTTMRV